MTDQDEVIRNLRSCLISCKGGIKLDNLRADYRMVAGEPLPYKQFGYSTVEAFVRTIPDVMVTRKNGELYVEAVPSKSTAHLTKLISRQKSTRRKAPKIKKWSPPRYAARNFSPGLRSNFNGSQYTKSSYVNSPGSFTRSTPGKSSLYTDFSRPIMPLMETVVQCPYPRNNEKPKIGPVTPPVSPTKRLKDRVTNISTLNQNGNNCKNIENVKCKVLNDKTATTVINVKSKTAEPKPSRLSERLRNLSPDRNIPQTLSPPPINNYNSGNNGSVFSSSAQPSITGMSKASSDPRKELETCANMMNLPSPMYNMYSKKDKHSTKVTIYASVKVGAHTFYTYPEDAASEQEAEKMAARLALVNLAKESASPEVTTVDTRVVRERILSIVTRHHSGIFMHLLPECYNDQYGEALPHNWERIVEESAEINQEKSVGGLTILCRTSQTLKRSDSNTPSKDVSDIASLSGEKIQLSPIGPAAPDKLIVPETTVWQVCVTHVVNAKEVWVRIGDDNDNFVDMMNDMKKHYSQAKEGSAGCSVGHFYTVQEDDYWHRVQCIESDSEAGLATVLFIDEGYEEQYKSNLLHPLEKKFCILPAQAIRVALQELEVFQDYAQATTEIENHLISDRMFLVTVHDTSTDECGSYTTVTFYDTSKEESDENVNEIIFDKILDHIIASSKVQAGKLIELYVTHIDNHAKVYAQLATPARNLLNDEIVSQAFANNVTNSLKGLNFTKMYLAKWNSQLYRARVTDIPSSGEVTVFLVDVGKTVTISKKNLLPIENFSKTLQCIPPQATQIYLQNISPSMYDDKLVARFRELISDTDLLLAKVVKIVFGVPEVEIFKRVGPNNILASINHSVILNSQLSKVNEDSNNNIKAKKRVERRNSRALEPVGKLNPPTISDIGQYFDVHVTLVAHPGHFIVQPLNDSNELKVMMENLQKCYVAYDGPPVETISEGMLYAGKFNNDWYRVYVTNIISDNEVSVYFCDFGDVTIVQRSSLQPLRSEFLKLPYQAVKAKLVGIEPVNADWSVNDCVRFKDLVLDKNFVSVVVESVFDHFSPANGTVLGLRLIDVSTEKDIYIDKLLVEEKRAKFIDGFEETLSSSS